MMCERCQERQANVQFTEIINGKKKTIRLCEVCAKEMHIDNFGWFPQLGLHTFLAGLLEHEFGDGNAVKTTPGENISCSKCGLTGEQFAKCGLLGCGDCYEDLAKPIDPLLRRIHGNSRHTGKVPERTGGSIRLVKEIENLKAELASCVVREEFEQAAVLRDQVRELEKEINRKG